MTRIELVSRFPNASQHFLWSNTDPIEVWEHYLSTKNIHITGTAFGVCGESARAKLIKAGYRLNSSKWSSSEISRLCDYYQNTPDNLFSIDALAREFKRSFFAIAIKAQRLGLTSRRTDSKVFSDSHRANMSAAQKFRLSDAGEAHRCALPILQWVKRNGRPRIKITKEQRELARAKLRKWHAENPHPRGMLGKHHTDEVRKRIGQAHAGRRRPVERTQKMLQTKFSRYGTLAPQRFGISWKSGWVEVGGKRFFSRSSWEVRYANRLELLKKAGEIVDWMYEPETFWFPVKRGTNNYTPDFKVIYPGGRIEFHEVKGWMDSKSQTKIRRMAIYHPKVPLIVVDKKLFKT